MTSYRYRCRRLARRYRYRKSGDIPKPVLVTGAAVLAIAAAGTHHAGTHHAGHGTAAAGITAAVPGNASLDTPAGWARALLAAGGLPQTSCNLSAVTAWEHAEGGGFGNQAAYDPLNLNPGPGAGWPGHPATGAWAFPDAPTGLRYTIRTLGNGNYGGVLAALRAGNSAQAVCDAIMASPWAASRYYGTLNASC